MLAVGILQDHPRLAVKFGWPGAKASHPEAQMVESFWNSGLFGATAQVLLDFFVCVQYLYLSLGLLVVAMRSPLARIFIFILGL